MRRERGMRAEEREDKNRKEGKGDKKTIGQEEKKRKREKEWRQVYMTKQNNNIKQSE